MRHIVLDTETTGFNAETDDRIVEIGAVELINFMPTGKVFHHYINPERAIPAEASAVHGITDKDVAGKPVYAEIVDALDNFLGDSLLVIHNAEFDMRFLNAEYRRLGLPALPMSRALDTLAIARKKFPGAPASLDALCKRFNVDLSQRTVHGALLDAQLLAHVFLELSGGQQPELLGAQKQSFDTGTDDAAQAPQKIWPARVFAPNTDEEQAHTEMLAGIKDALWGRV